MSQVSKRRVSEDIYNRIFEILTKTILQFNNKNDMSDFLQEYLTPTEKIMLSKRLTIAFMISKGYDYRTISDVLKVSTSTVRNINLTYKNGKALRIFVEKVKKSEEVSESIELIIHKAASALAAGAKGTQWFAVKRGIEEKRKRKVF